MNSRTFKVLISAILLLTIPSIFYSINTDFVMVDDLNDWGFGQLELRKWFASNFLSFDLSRFRPTWELNQFVAWKVFGPRPALHHALRLLMKAGIVFAIYKMLVDIFREDENAVRLSFFVFAAFYVFFPNTPESRLAPQELVLTLCFSILCFVIFRVTTRFDGDVYKNKVYYIVAIVAYFFLIGSKEVSIVHAFAIWIYLLACSKFSIDGFVKMLPFTILMIFGFLQVYFVFSNPDSYGKPPINWELLLSNYGNIKSFVFLTSTSKLITAAFLTGLIFGVYLIVKVIQSRYARLISREFPDTLREIAAREPLCFFIMCFIGFFAMSLTFWVPALRYFYPLIFVLICILSITVGKMYILVVPKFKQYLKIAVVVVSIYFIGANYYNFLLQYAAQFHNSTVEHQVIGKIAELIKQGKKVAVSGVDEHDIHMTSYFNNFSPYYFGTTSPSLEFNRTPVPNDTITYFVSRETVNSIWHDVAGAFRQNNMDEILKTAHRISCLLQQTNYPIAWVDGGADFNSKWGIFRSSTAALSEIVAEGQDVEIPGSDPFSEQVFQIKSDVLPNEDWGIELTYKTEGNAVPMVIVSGTPYRPEFLLVHKQIPATAGVVQSSKIPFEPNPAVLDHPELVFRNASTDGKFVVIAYRILKAQNHGGR